MKPTYSNLVKMLRELNDAACAGVLNALSPQDIEDQPGYRSLVKASDRADALLAAVGEAKPRTKSRAGSATVELCGGASPSASASGSQSDFTKD